MSEYYNSESYSDSDDADAKPCKRQRLSSSPSSRVRCHRRHHDRVIPSARQFAATERVKKAKQPAAREHGNKAEKPAATVRGNDVKQPAATERGNNAKQHVNKRVKKVSSQASDDEGNGEVTKKQASEATKRARKIRQSAEGLASVEGLATVIRLFAGGFFPTREWSFTAMKFAAVDRSAIVGRQGSIVVVRRRPPPRAASLAEKIHLWRCKQGGKNLRIGEISPNVL